MTANQLPPICKCRNCGFRTYDDLRDKNCPRCEEKGKVSAMECEDEEKEE